MIYNFDDFMCKDEIIWTFINVVRNVCTSNVFLKSVYKCTCVLTKFTILEHIHSCKYMQCIILPFTAVLIKAHCLVLRQFLI